MFNTACSVVGIRNLEMPEYTVIERDGRFEIREYPNIVIVETVASGDRRTAENQAFYRLFDYISGANEANGKIEMTAPVVQELASEKVAMTAPVLQESTPDGWRMAFVLPSRYSVETAPTPTNAEVTLRSVAPKRVAAMRFAGRMTQRSLEERAPELERWIESKGLEAISPFRSAGYDPPFTIPFLRRNEIMVDVGPQ